MISSGIRSARGPAGAQSNLTPLAEISRASSTELSHESNQDDLRTKRGGCFLSRPADVRLVTAAECMSIAGDGRSRQPSPELQGRRHEFLTGGGGSEL